MLIAAVSGNLSLLLRRVILVSQPQLRAGFHRERIRLHTVRGTDRLPLNS